MKKDIRSKLFSQNSVTMYMLVAAYAALSYMIYGGTASRQLSSMLIYVSCYIVMAVSLNLVVGLLGELSLGHAGFMSVGLFSGCMFSIATVDTLPLIIRLPSSMLIGGLAAAVIGLVVGLPALRLKGDYLAIVTLACGEIIKNIITNLKVTGGALGLNANSIYSNTKTLLPYAIAIVFITVLVMMNLKRSKQGRAIMAIRDNRIAAESNGVDVTYYKLMVFVLSAFFAGAAGALYGHSFANIKAAAFDYNMSIEILVIVVLGGMGSIRGSVIAAIILKALPEVLRGISDYRMLVYSILLIVLMLLNASPKFADMKGRWSIRSIFAALLRKKNNAQGTEVSENE
jgi:branched-chain amino acid transport system permease protein